MSTWTKMCPRQIFALKEREIIISEKVHGGKRRASECPKVLPAFLGGWSIHWRLHPFSEFGVTAKLLHGRE